MISSQGDYFNVWVMFLDFQKRRYQNMNFPMSINVAMIKKFSYGRIEKISIEMIWTNSRWIKEISHYKGLTVLQSLISPWKVSKKKEKKEITTTHGIHIWSPNQVLINPVKQGLTLLIEWDEIVNPFTEDQFYSRSSKYIYS